MSVIPPFAGKMGFASAQAAYSALGPYSLMPTVRPIKASVVIREVGGRDILDGSRAVKMERPKCPKSIMPFPNTFTMEMSADEFNRDAFTLLVKSSFSLPFTRGAGGATWELVRVHNMDLEPRVTTWPKGASVCEQAFLCRLHGIALNALGRVDPVIPYAVFACTRSCSYCGVSFIKGDLMTLVMKHPFYPAYWPSPAVVALPVAGDLVVPMQMKQTLVLVTESSHTVQVSAHGPLRVQGHTNRKSSALTCERLAFVPDSVEVSQKRRPAYKVTVPAGEKTPRMPVLCEMQRNFSLYAYHIDGFSIRMWKSNYHPSIIAPGTPLRVVSTHETVSSIERKFVVERRRDYFRFFREDHSWVIR